MITTTFRLNNKRLGMLAAAAVIIAIIIIIILNMNPGDDTAHFTVNSNEDIQAFLEYYGWSVDPEPISAQEIIIPAEFDDIYNYYNEIQLAQGMDLSLYAGQNAVRYTFRVHNHPTYTVEVWANVIVIDNLVIAGDITIHTETGIIHPLKLEGTGLEVPEPRG